MNGRHVNAGAALLRGDGVRARVTRSSELDSPDAPTRVAYRVVTNSQGRTRTRPEDTQATEEIAELRVQLEQQTAAH